MKTYSSVPVKEKLVSITCNLCGSDKTGKFLDCSDFYFVQCRNCGLVYQDPQPEFTDLQQRYRKNYFDYEISNEKNFFNLMQLGLVDIDFDRLTVDFENRNFLDIGCATGMLLEYMQSKGWQPKGVDICRESAEYGIRKRGLDIFIGPLQAAGYEENSFSVVHFSHLIEHVPDPAALLREVSRILRPGGIIIVTTPNAGGFQARLLGRHWRSAIADHLFLFTKRTLLQILKKTGFYCQQLVTWGGLARGLAPPVIKKPLDFLAKRWGFGDVMLALATKGTGMTAGASLQRFR